MKFDPQDPPRIFEVAQPASLGGPVQMKDCGRLHLTPDEQVTLITESGAEHDVVRMSWGFYPMPSLNSRLARFGLRAVLVKCLQLGHPKAKYFIFLVEQGREPGLQRYLDDWGYTIVAWLDSTSALGDLERKVKS